MEELAQEPAEGGVFVETAMNRGAAVQR